MSELTINSFLHIKIFRNVWIYFYFADFVIGNYNMANWQKLFNLLPGSNSVATSMALYIATCSYNKKLFGKGHYFEDKKPLTLSSLNSRQDLLTSCFNMIRRDWTFLHLGAKVVFFVF